MMKHVPFLVVASKILAKYGGHVAITYSPALAHAHATTGITRNTCYNFDMNHVAVTLPFPLEGSTTVIWQRKENVENARA